MVELRGFEPLTFCMPCIPVSSDGVALVRLPRVNGVTATGNVALRLAESGGVGTCFGTCFPVLPGSRVSNMRLPGTSRTDTRPLDHAGRLDAFGVREHVMRRPELGTE